MLNVSRIAENLSEIRGRIAAAAARSGRREDSVTLVAVTKYALSEAVRELVAAGCQELGESRPQQLWQRAATIVGADLHWHLIGHLQRNKINRTLPLVNLIQSCDTLRLAEALDAASAVRGIPARVLIEVNISADPSKHGFAVAEVAAAMPQLATLRNLNIRGLMAMAGRPDDSDAARADFRRLRQLRDRLRADCPPNIQLDELSMGMSGDFEAAIEEGATIVRIGSALFEGAG